MKKKHLQPLTPAALYARVSSNRQDVDLSVSAQPRTLKDYAKANGYSVAREYVDEAESGRVANRPQFRKMIEEGSKPKAPFEVILVWKFSPSPASASTPWPSSPSGARASAWCPSPSRPRTESGPRGHERDAGGSFSRLLGFRLRPLRLQPGHGPGRGQEASHAGARPGCGPHREAHVRHGRGWQGDGGNHQHPQRRGNPEPQG